MAKPSFGLILANRAVVLGAVKASDLVELAVEAERSGIFDAAWAGDSLLAKPRLESVTLLSALAGVTSRLRLAVGCMATFVHRHPVMLAHQWASLDVLSGGRRRLARHADGRMASTHSPGEFRQQWGRIATMAREEGRDPAKRGSALYHNININEDRQKALEETKAFLDTYYTAKFSPSFVEQWTV